MPDLREQLAAELACRYDPDNKQTPAWWLAEADDVLSVIDPDGKLNELGMMARVHEASEEGLFVYVCELCGQALTGPEAECHSGIHTGPSGEPVGQAVRSIDVWRKLNEKPLVCACGWEGPDWAAAKRHVLDTSGSHDVTRREVAGRPVDPHDDSIDSIEVYHAMVEALWPFWETMGSMSAPQAVRILVEERALSEPSLSPEQAKALLQVTNDQVAWLSDRPAEEFLDAGSVRAFRSARAVLEQIKEQG